jgi:hypothetical protein
MINLRSKSIGIFLFTLFFLTQLVCAEDNPPEQPPECLQCGTWQGLDGQILVINDNQIIIPGCGVFDYTIEESSVLQGKHKLLMSLEQSKESFLCTAKKGEAWTLDMEISGHMKDDSIAELNLRRGKSTTPVLWLYCWNIEREDPCDSGSGTGMSACSSIESSLIYKALSDESTSAYGILMNMKVKKLPSFNAERFSAAVFKFCKESEKNSGFNAWPEAYAYECLSDILKQKFEKFVSWHSCMYKKKNKLSSCKFPSESFDHSRKK